MRIDHAILAVADLGRAGDLLFERHGLASVPGGEHTGLGTANRIVPLGGDYVELLGVADPDLAGRNPLGQRILGQGTEGGRPMGWCLAVDDIEAVADRIGSVALPMTRTPPDGAALGWRLAGLERSLDQPHLPFFIAWDDPERHPGTEAAVHRCEPRRIARVEVTGDPEPLRAALAGTEVPVRISPGPSAVVAVAVETGEGEIVLR